MWEIFINSSSCWFTEKADVLNTSVIKYGPVVYGSNTFTYKLTGAPLLWNSIGVAKTLHVFLEKEKVTTLSYPHL